MNRMRSCCVVFIALTAISSPGFGEGMVTCKELGAVSTGIGWPARGKFSNDDYGFSIRVPRNVTAWSGVAKAAPFHGFGFSLDETRRSCIDFYLEWRVDDDEPPSLPNGLIPIPMAGATASVGETRGEIDGKPYLNRVVYFTRKRGEAFVDGRISLIVSAQDEKRAREIFHAFVRSLTFP